MMIRGKSVTRLAVMAAGAGLVLATVAACSSSSKAGGPTSSSITVAFIGSTQSAVYSFPESSDAVKARIDAVNAAGGVNGKKIKFITCNDKADPNQAAVCARQVKTDNAVAVVGGISAVGGSVTSALQAYGIIYTAERPISPGELNSTISYPLDGGATTVGAGMGTYAVKTVGCKRPYTVAGDVPADRSTSEAFSAGVKFASGKASAGEVTPATVTDYSAAASAAASAKADCIYFSINVPEMPKAIPAFKQANPGAKLMSSAANLPAPIIKALGSAANGFYLADSYLPVNTTGNATITQFKAEMAKYSPSATVDGFSLSSWLGTRILLDSIGKIKGSVNATSVRSYYANLSTVDGGGVVANFSFKTPSPLSSQPRAFNRSFLVYTVENGQYKVTDTTFGDATDALKLLK